MPSLIPPGRPQIQVECLPRYPNPPPPILGGNGITVTYAGSQPTVAISGAVPIIAGAVRTAQFLHALENLAAGNIEALAETISANRGDPVNLAFNKDPFVAPNGVLANATQAKFGFSNPQMTALFIAAALIPN